MGQEAQAIQGALSWLSMQVAPGTNMDDANDRHIGAMSALDRFLDRIAQLESERDRYRDALRQYDGGWCMRCGQSFEQSSQEASTENLLSETGANEPLEFVVVENPAIPQGGSDR